MPFGDREVKRILAHGGWELGDANGFEIVDVANLKERSDDAWRCLALPPGWAFVLGPDGHEDLYEESDALD